MDMSHLCEIYLNKNDYYIFNIESKNQNNLSHLSVTWLQTKPIRQSEVKCPVKCDKQISYNASVGMGKNLNSFGFIYIQVLRSFN